jgi:hypothetical protein
VLPFETCGNVVRKSVAAGAPATFTATFRTRKGTEMRATLVEEHEVVRLSALSGL